MAETLGDLVRSVCGQLNDEDIGRVLWGASSYPFGDSESVRATLSEAWEKGGRTVDGAIDWSCEELSRQWEAERAQRG